ncbi:hypothetical protein TNCV_694561 [Trichonephila clavipes]|nr:hypothetical protein TNCV_694561 [Trichonephila clavipes]
MAEERISLHEWCCDSYKCGHRKGDLIEPSYSDASKLTYGAAVYVKAFQKDGNNSWLTVQEITKLTDPDSWFHCSGQDNPSDFLSWRLGGNGPAFLKTDELPETVSEYPELIEEEYLPELKSKDS